MNIDKEKLIKIAKPIPEETRRKMMIRKQNRYLNATSATIAAKILRQMKVTGMTKGQLAEKLNITQANITRYLNGKCNFELRTLVEMERVLNINIIDRTIIPETKNAQLLFVFDNRESKGNSFISSPHDIISYIENA